MYPPNFHSEYYWIQLSYSNIGIIPCMIPWPIKQIDQNKEKFSLDALHVRYALKTTIINMDTNNCLDFIVEY